MPPAVREVQPSTYRIDASKTQLGLIGSWAGERQSQFLLSSTKLKYRRRTLSYALQVTFSGGIGIWF